MESEEKPVIVVTPAMIKSVRGLFLDVFDVGEFGLEATVAEVFTTMMDASPYRLVPRVPEPAESTLETGP